MKTVDQKAVDAARIEYGRAAQAAETIRTSNNFEEIKTAWSSFLVSSGRIYTKLEQGSKTDESSRTWWGKQVHERRSDPLLCYLWHARNVDEHTLQNIAEFKEATVKSAEPTPDDVEALNSALANEQRPTAILGLLEVVWAHVKMLDVLDRGVRYCPPTKRLALEITDTSPANIVTLALSFFEEMISEAAHLALTR